MDLNITRLFSAPQELLWKAFTDPEMLKQWWGPKDTTAPVVKVDLRVGGKYTLSMRTPGGKDFWNKGTFKEIEPMDRLVSSMSFADKQGNIVNANFYGLPGKWPMEILWTVTFTPEQGKTRVTIVQSGIPEGKALDDTAAGWNQSLDKLEEALIPVSAS